MISLAKLSIRRPKAALCGWLLVAIALVTIGFGVSGTMSPSITVVKGTESARAQKLADQAFGPTQLVPILLEGPKAELNRVGPRLVVALNKRPHTRLLSAWDAGTAAAGLRPRPTGAKSAAGETASAITAAAGTASAAKALAGQIAYQAPGLFAALNMLHDGAAQLHSGLSQLLDGNAQLAEGIGKLAGGGGQLRSGLGQLTSGAGQLQAGLQLLTNGVGPLAFGLSAAPDGAGQLKTGLGQMQAAVIKARGQIPSTKDLETLLRQLIVIAGALALVLALALRAIVLPVAAVILNLLVVSAAFGVVQMLFGGSNPPLGGPGYLDPITIISIFSVAFGISVSYSTVLLMRTREAYERRGNPRNAARAGLNHTAAPATGAAIAMVAAMIPFATTELINVRELGVGVGVAVLLVALVLRPVLLPAAEVVLGRIGWWPTHGPRAPKEPPPEIPTRRPARMRPPHGRPRPRRPIRRPVLGGER
jgi:X-X-X-Leu-X-X-Gly heptad repeat protein